MPSCEPVKGWVEAKGVCGCGGMACAIPRADVVERKLPLGVLAKGCVAACASTVASPIKPNSPDRLGGIKG